MMLTDSDSQFAWAALKEGLITLKDVEDSLKVQDRERSDPDRHPRSLALILVGLGRLQDSDLARLFSSRSA